MPRDPQVAVTFTAETTAARLAFMGNAIGRRDPKMAALLNAGALAWHGGDRGPVLAALVDLADDLWAETQADVAARRAQPIVVRAEVAHPAERSAS